MPVKSDEAIMRKAANKKARRKAARGAFKFDPHLLRKGSPAYRRQLPKFPGDMSKSELRAIIAAAVENRTAING